MDNSEELLQYIGEIKGFLGKFVKGSEIFLPTEEQALFKQKILEVKDLLDEMFGEKNTYSSNLIHTFVQGTGGYFRGPSVACVHDIVAVLNAAHKKFLRENQNNNKVNKNELKRIYIDEKRIDELKSIKSNNIDLKKLIKLCEEINIANQTQSYLSIIMLIRALIDHIPPIFSLKSFSEVANNYGGKSFKDLMNRLDVTSRKLADHYLHKQIQSKEDLPNFTQVNFTNEIDLLLSEIIKRLK